MLKTGKVRPRLRPPIFKKPYPRLDGKMPLSSKDANTFFENLSGRRCYFTFEKGKIIIRMHHTGQEIHITPENGEFSFVSFNIRANYLIQDEEMIEKLKPVGKTKKVDII